MTQTSHVGITTNAAGWNKAAGNADDHGYLSYLERVGARFAALPVDATLFETDATGLWEAYLESFPAAERQYHACNSCRRFVETYGALVTIAEDGAIEPAFWNTEDCNPGEAAPVAAMLKLVRRAKVTGPFLTSESIWGQPATGVWRHVHLLPRRERVYPKGGKLTAGQAAAEKRQDFQNVFTALGEYPAAAVHQALALLKSEQLFRSEKVLGQAQFLADLHAALEAHPNRRANVVWRLVAPAPAGFCHPRSSMIGTLLDDIVAGKNFEEAARAFRIKMDPRYYQRPQAAPTAGNIATAERIVERMGLAPSLERRFARFDEIQTIWKPTPAPAKVPAGGVFGHLAPKGDTPAVPSMATPVQVITWEKFARTALPDARNIDVLVPTAGNFAAIVTAAHADAPPILQWDSPEKRNPCSWYLYRDGSLATRWGLAPGWRKVTGIALQPSMWTGSFAHMGKGAIVVIDGARDSEQRGAVLFPEILRSDLHEIRPTIEAHSKSSKLSGFEEASACGLMFPDGQLRVTDRNGVVSTFRITSWD